MARTSAESCIRSFAFMIVGRGDICHTGDGAKNRQLADRPVALDDAVTLESIGFTVMLDTFCRTVGTVASGCQAPQEHMP
jgi:hypothetical protein